MKTIIVGKNTTVLFGSEHERHIVIYTFIYMLEHGLIFLVRILKCGKNRITKCIHVQSDSFEIKQRKQKITKDVVESSKICASGY